MGSLNSNKYGTGKPAIEATVAGQPVTIVGQVSVTVASGKLTDGDMLNFCVVPAGHKVVGCAVSCGDLDAGTALVFDVGLRDAADAVLETVFISGSDIGQAGGCVNIPTTAVMMNTAAATVEKVVSLEVTTSAGTIHAADRVLDFAVTYVAV